MANINGALDLLFKRFGNQHPIWFARYFRRPRISYYLKFWTKHFDHHLLHEFIKMFRNNTSKFKIIITIFTWNPCHNILQIPFYLSPSKRKFSIRMKIQNSHPISIFEISFIRTNYERIPSTSNIFLFSKIRINFKRIRNHIKFIF